MQYNIAGLPVGVVPVTRVDPARDALPRDATGAPAWPASAGPGGGSRIVTAAARKVYDEVRMAGVPVAVQVRMCVCASQNKAWLMAFGAVGGTDVGG
jgi:hypothetical protein